MDCYYRHRHKHKHKHSKIHIYYIYLGWKVECSLEEHGEEDEDETDSGSCPCRRDLEGPVVHPQMLMLSIFLSLLCDKALTVIACIYIEFFTSGFCKWLVIPLTLLVRPPLHVWEHFYTQNLFDFS